MRNVDLSSILDLYMKCFDQTGSYAEKGHSKSGGGRLTGQERQALDITQVADAAHDFLAEKLQSDLPFYFVRSVIESVAYTASRFAAADYPNAQLYRSAALQILETGLPLESNPRSG